MGQYRNILVIADPEHPGSPALRRAGALAKATGATLHLRAFVHHPAISTIRMVSAQVSDLARKELIHERRDWLEREADTLRAGDIAVRVDVIWGQPLHEKIIAEVFALRPDLVLKDVAVAPALKRLLFTPQDWPLVRLCPAPLLIVNRADRPAPRRIIAAIDTTTDTPESSALNEDILRAALALALQCDAEVDVMHAFEGLPPLMRGVVAGPAMQTPEVYDQLRQARAERFHAFLDRFGVPPERRRFMFGLADQAIAELAEDLSADVVVMGTVHRTPLERIIIGSTAERMLGVLACDLLVLKPRNFVDALARQYKLEKAAA